MDWIEIIKNGELRRVRPHGLEQKLSQGWTLAGANQETEQPKIVPDTLPKTRKRKEQTE